MHVNVSSSAGPEGPSVVIRAVNWGIRGSPLMKNLGLDRRFSLDFATTLSWTPAADAAAAGSASGNGAEVARMGESSGRPAPTHDLQARCTGCRPL